MTLKVEELTKDDIKGYENMLFVFDTTKATIRKLVRAKLSIQTKLKRISSVLDNTCAEAIIISKNNVAEAKVETLMDSRKQVREVQD